MTTSTPKIAIVMGSKSDWATMQEATQILDELKVPYHVEVVSAHRTPDKLFSFAETAEEKGYKVIIAGAGGAAHLPGMIAAKTLVPVLGVPVKSSMLSGVDSLYSIVLMAKLCKALSTKTKLILLGDKDQLSSVEAGATLGELGQFIYWHFDEKQQKNIGCYSPEFTQYLTAVTGENLPPSQKVEPLTNCLCFLPDSRRFTENSGIGQLAKKVNQVNQKVSSWELFNQHFDVGQISVIELKVELKKEQQEPENEKNELTYLNQIAETAVEKYQDYLAIVQRYQSTQNKEELTHLFKAFNSARFLTALRQGEFGVEGLNQRIAEKLKEKGLVTFKQERDWYIGKPIMITQNDPNTKLSNGDIGIYVGNNQICFEEDGLRFVSKSRIPTGFETAYTMTVHKSQGSEFSHTFLILPKENNPLLTKELIYTAITRARDTFTLFSAKSLWESAVKRESKRQSGLKNRLKLAFDQRNVKKL